jgi:hypothetical protein
LCVAELEEVVEFMEEVIAGLLADQEVRTFSEVIGPVLDIFQGRVKDLDLCQLLLFSYLDLLLYFSRQKDIATVRGRNALSSLLWTVFYNPDYILCCSIYNKIIIILTTAFICLRWTALISKVVYSLLI